MKSWAWLLGVFVCSPLLAYGGNVRVDPNFNVQLDGTITAIEVQPDGKILIGGYFNTVNGVSRPKLGRLNSDGSVDQTFEIRGTFPGAYVRHLLVHEEKFMPELVNGTAFIALTQQERLSSLTLLAGLSRSIHTDGWFGVNSQGPPCIHGWAVSPKKVIMIPPS